MPIFKRTDRDFDPFIKSNTDGSIMMWRSCDGDFCMCANTAPNHIWKNDPDIAQTVYETAFIFSKITKATFKEAYKAARLVLCGYKFPMSHWVSSDGSMRIDVGEAHRIKEF